MTKCDNCYNAEICKNYPNTGLPPKIRNELLDKGCEHFKDKSLIVELPCRVGDTVYIHYVSPFNEIRQTKIDRIEIHKEYIQVVFSNDSTFTVWNNDWSVYKNAVLSTREEADRALAERELKENE